MRSSPRPSRRFARLDGDIPDNYRVLPGRAALHSVRHDSHESHERAVADYVVSGSWSKKAWKEAKIFGDARMIGNSEDENFSYVGPDVKALEVFRRRRLRLHLPERNDLRHRVPRASRHQGQAARGRRILVLPVRADRRSERYGLIYGGVQKNVGPAGVCIVIIREDLIPEETLPRRSRHVCSTRRMPTRRASTTRRRATASISAASCSSGSRPRAAWRP